MRNSAGWASAQPASVIAPGFTCGAFQSIWSGNTPPEGAASHAKSLVNSDDTAFSPLLSHTAFFVVVFFFCISVSLSVIGGQL